ncbi:MAG: threonine ammonia-lyase [Betaproteobacteria bacterium]|nr:threonine ammonia-lyase [Betaproteobacteria bacterium]
MSAISLADVQAARGVLAGHVANTPCLHSRTLSEITGAEVYLKFENHQFTASFKERGALNKLVSLTPEQKQRGVVAASAGNHAQGVSHHATRLGIPSIIVMPKFTPNVKVEMTQRHGATVVLHGENFDEAKAHALKLAEEKRLTFVHPYDDARVIAGQGTIALEMLEAHPELDMLCIAIGGGGLIGGMATAAKALRPDIDVIGVETVRFPSMYAAINKSAAQFGPSTIAEGIAVKEPGKLTREIVERTVSDILLVDEGDIEQAIVMLLEIEKTVVEGAGAASLAALMKYPEKFAGRKVGLVLCGGNIDPLMLAEIIQRGMVRSGRLSRLKVELRDLPGALAKITGVIAEANANIEEVHHQRAFTNLPVQTAEVEFVLKTRNAAQVDDIVARLAEAGFKAYAPDSAG